MISNDIFYQQEVVIKAESSDSDDELNCKGIYEGLFPTSFVEPSADEDVDVKSLIPLMCDDVGSTHNDLSPASSPHSYNLIKENGSSMLDSTLIKYSGSSVLDNTLPSFSGSSMLDNKLQNYIGSSILEGNSLPKYSGSSMLDSPLQQLSVSSMLDNILPKYSDDVESTSDQENDITPRKESSKSVHNCAICMFHTDGKEELREHVVEHIGGPDNETYLEFCMKGDVYYCFFCKFTSLSIDKFSAHTNQHKLQAQSSSCRKRQAKRDIQYDEDRESIERSPKKKVDHSNLTMYRCKLCKYSTYNVKQLSKHQKIHSKSKRFSCPNCNFSTGSSKIYYSHLEIHKVDRPYPCTICEYRGRTKSGLNQHKQTHGDQKFKCSFCEYRSCKQARVVRHERIHTGEKPFKCPHCDFSCNQDGTLNIHKRRHTGHRPYKCDMCSFVTISCSSLKTHRKKHFTDKRTFECDVCHQVFLSAGSVKVHMKKHRVNSPVKGIKRKVPKEKQKSAVSGVYFCKECDFHCTKFGELMEHRETHGEDSPNKKRLHAIHRCPTCGMEFNRRRELRAHKDVHNEESSDEKDSKKPITISLGKCVLSVTED